MSLSEPIASTRRLAAILAADVAGYSRLMGADEEGTLARLQAHRRELLDPKIRDCRGRIVKTTGDGMLVEFASVVDAVRCAVELQRAMGDREAALEEDQRIRFRVGINLGDIIADGNDIFGDGVNVAARLEALAEPGGVCISGTVRDHVGDRLPYAFEDIGEQDVKNIARPVSAFRVSVTSIAATPLVPVQPPAAPASHRIIAAPAVIAASLVVGVGIAAGIWQEWPNTASQPTAQQAPPAVASSRVQPAPRLSIVVLPFTNLSNDPEQEYFVDAVTDDLTTDLSRIVNSFVIARTTAFTYKGRAVDVKQLGRELGVRYVLEGSVRRLGEQVQVNVQLIDAENGAHIWADRFDTDRANLPKAQGEITARLARSLQLQLLEVVGRRIEQDQPANLDARDLIMRGWALYLRPQSATNLQQAQKAFEQALAIDPESVDARTGIAMVLGEFLATGLSKSREQDMARADQLLGEALERDRNHSRAHAELGRLRRIQGRLVESQIELEKAVALDRNNPQAILQSGITLLYLGQPEAALPSFEKFLQLNPQFQNLFFIYYWLGQSHLLLSRADEATVFLRKGLSANPQHIGIHLLLAAALGLRGDVDEARAALAEFLKLKPEWNSFARLPDVPYMHHPQFVALREKTINVGLRRAGLPDQ
jgi:TolB-like protein/class 3 adenylate cyclase/Tfp pilus assembly protein PilF